MADHILTMRPFIPAGAVPEVETLAAVPFGELLELPYESLLTPTQRRLHQKLQTALGDLFAAAGAEFTAVDTCEGFSLETVALQQPESAVKKEDSYTNQPVQSDALVFDEVTRLTDADGKSLYHLFLPFYAAFMPESIEVVVRQPGRHPRGTTDVVRNHQLKYVAGDEVAVTPDLMLALEDRPVVAPAIDIRWLIGRLQDGELIPQETVRESLAK